MSKRFLLTTLVFTGVHVALFLSVTLLMFILFIFFFTEEGEPNFVETSVIPAAFTIIGVLSFPGELLFEKFRIEGTFSVYNPLLKQAMFWLNSLLWGVGFSLVWILLKSRRREIR